MVRRALFLLLVLGLAACGGFENEPLLYGVIRGQLAHASADALVSVEGLPELRTVPDATGAFELRHVPLGPVTLLILENATSAQRVDVQVGAAEIVELGALTSKPAGEIEIDFTLPGHLPLVDGAISLEGTPFTAVVAEGDHETDVVVPAGCYDVSATAKGVGSVTVNVCVQAGQRAEQHVEFPRPDGSAGREGCAVTGCDYPYFECERLVCEL